MADQNKKPQQSQKKGFSNQPKANAPKPAAAPAPKPANPQQSHE